MTLPPASDFAASVPEALQAGWVAHTVRLLDSYQRLLGRPLLENRTTALEDAARAFAAPFALLSHGTEADPILNYGNARVLALWEMSVARLIATPSRETAEPILQNAREKLLRETRAKGFVTGYSGVRISARGKRFKIENVTIWTVIDEAGQTHGQAAAFDTWTGL